MHHDDLAHQAIRSAYVAYSTGEALPADRIIIVLDSISKQIAAATLHHNGNGLKGKVKQQAPSAFGGMGLGAVLVEVLRVLV